MHAAALLATALNACTGGSVDDGTGSGGSGPGTGGAMDAAGSGGASGPGTGGTSGGGGRDGGAADQGGSPGPGSGGTGITDGGGDADGGAVGDGGGGTPTPLGPELTDLTTLTTVNCAITASVTPATGVPMVGVATFTTDLAGAERAVIQFGKSATYTLEAPVNWPEPMHRTLLLGMPRNMMVHYRVVVMQGKNACVSADATYMTGAVTGAPANVTPQKGSSAAAPAPGFIVTSSGNYASIVNVQGEVVWAHRFPISLTRAVMSFDGNYMYGRDTGPFNAGTGGNIYRVAMDGSGEMKLTVSGGSHHDMNVIPTGIAYLAKRAAGVCDSLYVAGPDGSNSKALVDMDVVFGKFAVGAGGSSQEKCHCNAIRYYKDTNTFSVSDREKDAIAFFSSTGELLGSIGATPTAPTPNHAKAEGADSQRTSLWRVQHGHDQYAPNKIVLWSNGNMQGGMSHALHYTINGATAKLDWQYAGAGNAGTFGDAQHLPNGNFLITNTQSGAVHEIDTSQQLVQSFANLAKSYPSHRPTLYGPPPGR